MGGGGSQTVTQNSSPWTNQQPYLQSIYAGAWNNLQNNTPQYYPGPQVAPINNQQAGSLWTQYDTALNGGTAPMQAGNNYETNTLNGANLGTNPGSEQAALIGSNAMSNPANASAATLMNGEGFSNPSNLGTSLIANGGGLANPATADLTNMAAGGLVGANAPGFQNVVSNTLASVMPSIESTFAGGGRMDSGDAASAAAEGATNAVGNLEYGNYNTQLQNQLSAAGLVGNNFNTGIGNELGANSLLSQNFGMGLNSQATGAGLLSNNFNTGITNQLGAAGITSGNYQNDQNNQRMAGLMAPSYDAQTMNDLSTSLNLGNMEQNNSQQNINADINKWNYNQMLPYNQMSMFANMVNGTNVPPSTVTTQPYYSNTVGNILGAAMGGTSILNGLNNMGSGGTGGIGQGLSWLMSMAPNMAAAAG